MGIDQDFLAALQASYRSILTVADQLNPELLRRESAQQLRKAFQPLKVEIRGSENLPYEQGVIFIYNHLDNHPYLTVATNFQITLDSHFISSVILDKYYQNPGTRVVRESLPSESNHKAYYDRFDYIRVYSKNFLPEGISKEKIRQTNKEFYQKATAALDNNILMVFSPEGSSYATNNSPGPFHKGIFKLACSHKKQPLIVPIVMVNFDKLPSEAPYKCQIMPPFRMSDFEIESPNDLALEKVVHNLNRNYRKWVQELSLPDTHFQREIKVLKHKIQRKENKDNLLVFYGSSTLRLWKNVQEDFPEYNCLNLGFGGAFIHSMEHYFEELFADIQPTALVLYLGGNDLTLALQQAEITAAILALVERIHLAFPKAQLYNIAIKPSMERADQLDTIMAINKSMKKAGATRPYLHQVDFYDCLLHQEQIDTGYFLQDGLHLNAKGYKVLTQAIRNEMRLENPLPKPAKRS